MHKKPIILFTQPIDRFFFWQIHLYIESCLEAGFDEDRIQVLLYKPKGREYDGNAWGKLLDAYPKVKIFVYEDRGVQQYLSIYLPILRPHTLWQHFQAFPELQNETILYTDCDILWIEGLDIQKYFDDDVCYVSDASSYLNVSYLESKIRDVLPEKLEEYKSRDIVGELSELIGIDKKIVIENNNNTGGVQYILKNIDASFWKKIEEDVLKIRMYFTDINKKFFENENKGFQGWCADLWALQYNLWMKEGGCKVAPEMEFAWATDNIEKLKRVGIFHNAGITGTNMNGVPCFYKGKYHLGSSPFVDPLMDEILANKESQKKCTWYYTKKLDELRKKYILV